ncbi:MAG: 3-phosphoserine/phosphohydroxythreonine transaminase [Myxococcota bacterium]
MAERPLNFYPGPAILPLPVLEEASRGVLALDDVGLSILEISHRSPTFDRILEDARTRLRRLLDVPETHDVLFLQGGARGQFAQVPLNFLEDGRRAGYVVTGTWGEGALAEANRLGEAVALASGDEDDFSVLPDLSGVDVPGDLAYVHTTSNNTVYGTQWQDLPDFGGVRHVCDMSSDILSRPVDVSRFGLIYAGAQKNAGPAGVTLVIAEKAWMESAREDIPAIWRYQTQANKGSTYNTPPVGAIYVVGLVAKWLEEQGGVAAMGERNERKASMVYEALDEHPDLYRPTVPRPDHRSRMNVTWRMRTPDLEKQFLAGAEEAGMVGLKGHRKVGGLRASLYNAMSVEGTERLVAWIEDFGRKHA